MSKRYYYGGQAVMEGVMMRAPHSYCVAVRKSNGEIITEQQPLPKISEQYPIFKLPVLRRTSPALARESRVY